MENAQSEHTFVGPLADELWGDFDAVCKCSEETFVRVRNLSRLLANLATANDEHATALTKLTPSNKKSRSKSTTTGSTCDTDGLADAVQMHMNGLAEMHRNLSIRITEEIVVPLDQRVKNLSARQEAVAKKGRDDKKIYDEEVNRLNKARHAYYKSCKQVEDSEKSKEKPRNNIMQKLQDKVRGDTDSLVAEREKLKTEYKDTVKRANDAQRQWFCHDLRKCFDQLEAIDRERIDLTKSTLDKLVAIFGETPKAITSWASSLETISISQGSNETLAHYLVDSKTKEEGPSVFTFAEPSEDAPSRAVLHVRGMKRGSIVSCDSAGLEDTYMEVTATRSIKGKALDGRDATLTLKEGQRVKVTRSKGATTAQKILDEQTSHRTIQFRDVKAEFPSDLLRDVPIGDRPIFQFPLDAIVSRDQQRLGNVLENSNPILSNVPVIVQTLANKIFSLDAEHLEGIFRVPGNSRSVEKNRDFINLGADEVLSNDPHVCASLFKLFFRELPDPVVPNEFYEQCIAVHSAPESQQGQQAIEVLEKFPSLNKALCMYVIAVLQRFAQPDAVAVTRMDSSNLAMVFSACFFRGPPNDGGDAMAAAVNAGREKTFVKALIDSLPPQKSLSAFPDPLGITIEYSAAPVVPEPKPAAVSEPKAAVAASPTPPPISTRSHAAASVPALPSAPPPVVTSPQPPLPSGPPPTMSRVQPSVVNPSFGTAAPSATLHTNLFGDDVDVNAYITSRKANTNKGDDLFADD